MSEMREKCVEIRLFMHTVEEINTQKGTFHTFHTFHTFGEQILHTRLLIVAGRLMESRIAILVKQERACAPIFNRHAKLTNVPVCCSAKYVVNELLLCTVVAFLAWDVDVSWKCDHFSS